jgi:Bacterial SH3 domain
MMAELFTVNATSLNIRSTPMVAPDNKIGVLMKGQTCTKLDATSDPWWKVSAILNGQTIEGFVHSQYLSRVTKIVKAISWFKAQFRSAIKDEILGTPFSLDMLTAIALQETYYVWGNIYQDLSVEEVLKVCVGDTLDAPNRSAFPKNKAALLSVENGDEMFEIARDALASVANHIPAYRSVFQGSPNKFCHGFGIFQYDIQFFRTDTNFFLQKRWYMFDNCLKHCVKELKAALRRAYGADKSTLSDEEKVYVAIAYNKGSVNTSGGFKQGYRDDSGKFYGEYIWEYLQLSKSVS